jgi:hypothetical protein
MAHDQCRNEHKRTPSDKEKPQMSPVVEIFEAPADEHSKRAKPREQAQRLANDREHGDQHGTARQHKQTSHSNGAANYCTAQ